MGYLFLYDEKVAEGINLADAAGDTRRIANWEGNVKYFIAFTMLLGTTVAAGSASRAWSYEDCVLMCVRKVRFNVSGCIARVPCAQYPRAGERAPPPVASGKKDGRGIG